MILEIMYNSELPIYEQIIRQIVIAFHDGSVIRGESLPSVRALAADVGVNLHTVNKAYQILQDMGYIIMDRRVGAKIADPPAPIGDKRKQEICAGIEFMTKDLHNLGCTKEEILEMIAKGLGD